MVDLLILGMIAAGFLLYVADRVVKARARARRLRMMSERLAAAAARAEEQQAEREASAAAGAALTSVVPAINHPALTGPGQVARGEARGPTPSYGSASRGRRPRP